MPTRQQMWDALGPELDVLVIGGGINGAGIARDAAMRGLKVALVEMKDIAYGTSSRSSKLVHGGLRYLEQLEFSLVFESVSERRILLDIAPHLVNPLGFLFPVYKGARRGIHTINAGMWIYDGLALFRTPRRHRKMKPADVAREEPALKSEDLQGAPLYYDCSTDDARLTLESALDAAARGAVVSTYTKCVSFLKGEDGRINGAVVRCQLTGALKEVKAAVVINATGPWTDRTIAMSTPSARSLLRPTKGVHIVVPHGKLPVNHAVVCFHPEDKRVLFAIPWGDSTYIGTTDTDYEGDPGQVCATRADVDYLIKAAEYYFPDNPITYDDVVSTWAGLRPLIGEEGVDESAVSREHEIVIGEDGLVTIAGGKLTTFRRMSAEVVDVAAKWLRMTGKLPGKLKPADTDGAPLPGAINWPPDDDHNRVAREIRSAAGDKISEASALLLANTYGMRGIKVGRLVYANPELAEPMVEGRPEIMAQVDFGVGEELATTVTDMLIQRTQIFYRDPDQGLNAAPKIAQRMATLLGWDEETTASNVERYRHDVALSRQWKDEIAQAT
ncbi:MAG: glycerol-3-phosphate dehydrogenase [bacterium]